MADQKVQVAALNKFEAALAREDYTLAMRVANDDSLPDSLRENLRLILRKHAEELYSRIVEQE